jgi:hypothetical protein
MTKNIFVRDASEFELTTTSLWNLYNAGSLGFESKGSIIDRATGFLQRLAQTSAWTSNDNEKCKEYINSLIKGNSLLDCFVVVPAELLQKTVKMRIISSSGEIKEAWQEVEKYLEERVQKGTMRFIIDGQNRLFEALVPFFNNQISLSSEHSLTICIDGVDHDCRGRKFKELNSDIQEYIKSIRVPFVTGTRGELEHFCDTLIWKNEGVAWDDWQKMVTKKWFTKYLRQVRQVSDRDTTDPRISNLLGKIAGKDYEYEKNGWDRIVSELLMWMERGVQSKNTVEESKAFFDGNFKILQSQVDCLKRYLKEFAEAYSPNVKNGADSNSRGITNTELRNYVYLRYALDYPKNENFKGLSVPNWKIQQPPKFAKQFKQVNRLLMENPEQNYGELPNNIIAIKNGKRLKGKNPGSYAHSNSFTEKSHINTRLEILFSVLAGRKPESKSVFDELVGKNIISAKSDDNVPSMAKIHADNPYTADGDYIDIMDYDDTSLFDVGHVNPESKGGSNKDVVLQKKSPNRKLQDNSIPS